MTYVLWIAIAMMLSGAIFLVTGIGAAGLWIAVIAVGVCLVAIDGARRHSLDS